MFLIVGTVTRYPKTGFFTAKFCPSCNQYVEMHEVKPKEYFSIFGVPIFPIGQKNPILECPICHERFYSVSSDNNYHRTNATDGAKSAIVENPRIVACKSCGQKLRLPNAGSYRCPKCKTVGHVDGENVIDRVLSNGKTSIQSIRITSKNSDNHPVGVTVVVVAFIVMLIGTWKNNQGGAPPASIAVARGTITSPAVKKLDEKPLPRNGSLRISSGREGVVPFRISTKSGAHHLVKLRSLDGTTETITIFIQEGKTVEVYVPIGCYELKIASGRKWYGYSKYFGREGVYSKAQDMLTFSYDTDGISEYKILRGYKILLYGVLNGNLKTHEIAPEDF